MYFVSCMALLLPYLATAVTSVDRKWMDCFKYINYYTASIVKDASFAICVGGCLVCWLGWDLDEASLIPTNRPDSHPYRVKNTCVAVSSPNDGYIVARNMYRSWNKCSKKQCAPSWLHLKKILTSLVKFLVLKKKVKVWNLNRYLVQSTWSNVCR